MSMKRRKLAVGWRARWSVRVEFKAQDCWIGAYWRHSACGTSEAVDVWVCLLPMLPIHVRCERTLLYVVRL